MAFQIDPPLLLNGVASIGVASDGSLILQTGDDSTGPLAAFVLGTDGTINGHELGQAATPAPTTPVIEDSGWVAPTLIGTWVNNGNTALQSQAPAGFRKIGKQVQFRGLIKNASAANPTTGNLFKLPDGFYPKRQLQFIVSSMDKAVSLKVQTDGWVYVIGADTSWVSLDMVSFLVD